MFLTFFSRLVIISIHDVLGAAVDEKQKGNPRQQSNKWKENNFIDFGNKTTSGFCGFLLGSHAYYNSKIKQTRAPLIHKSPDWGFCVSTVFLSLKILPSWTYYW